MVLGAVSTSQEDVYDNELGVQTSDTSNGCYDDGPAHESRLVLYVHM